MIANMKLYRSIDGVILENEKVFKSIQIDTSWNDFIDREDLHSALMSAWKEGRFCMMV